MALVSGVVKLYCILAITGWTVNNLTNFCVYLIEIGMFTVKNKLRNKKRKRSKPINKDYVLIPTAPTDDEQEYEGDIGTYA